MLCEPARPRTLRLQASDKGGGVTAFMSESEEEDRGHEKRDDDEDSYDGKAQRWSQLRTVKSERSIKYIPNGIYN